ncbi:2OG-Fe(II) oxygenase family protein [Xenorhabdus griffiniae]|uniref:2OG-Fe(II) oxygenase family protein n=1 Tax=Xenorhabdus griffiniae TaxID=351672 RepID=UPI002358D582|nr:2OG-Fe(II) oxygenase family protein [Xenorhabdus griffiniae]MDC9607179.1 2OG-Fe(II) oxygenase family protein [Xenorhabdus griffiniae]
MKEEVPYRWAEAKLNEGEIFFNTHDGFKQAIQDGFFFIEKPKSIALNYGDLFANEFYKNKKGERNDEYRGFRFLDSSILGKREGYFLRKEDQVEQFFLEQSLWERFFPNELSKLAYEMKKFAIQILEAILRCLNIPTKLWDKATGYSLSGRGTYHLTFNHFRPSVRARGLNIHKDSGWITILRSLEPGLEILRKQEWIPILPKEDNFIVNFGCAMEILTKDTDIPVAAVAHRVTEQKERNLSDRFSYALFVDSSLDKELCEGLYRYHPTNGLLLETDFEDFLDKIVYKTYEKDTQGLY